MSQHWRDGGCHVIQHEWYVRCSLRHERGEQVGGNAHVDHDCGIDLIREVDLIPRLQMTNN